jgi:nucleoside-diphosphate-sugar epimerase
MDLIREKFGWEPKISLREGMTRVYNAAVDKLKKEGKL